MLQAMDEIKPVIDIGESLVQRVLHYNALSAGFAMIRYCWWRPEERAFCSPPNSRPSPQVNWA
jgi:hypothetical protein